MTNGSGSLVSAAEDLAYFDDGRLRSAREALRNFPINTGAKSLYESYLMRYGYEERHEDIEALVLRMAQQDCRAFYPDGEHPFMKLEKLPNDYLRDSRKPPSGRTLRDIARIRRIVRTIERHTRRRNSPVA